MRESIMRFRPNGVCIGSERSVERGQRRKEGHVIGPCSSGAVLLRGRGDSQLPRGGAEARVPNSAPHSDSGGQIHTPMLPSPEPGYRRHAPHVIRKPWKGLRLGTCLSLSCPQCTVMGRLSVQERVEH